MSVCTPLSAARSTPPSARPYPASAEPPPSTGARGLGVRKAVLNGEERAPDRRPMNPAPRPKTGLAD